jgi:hypothetical protein
MNTIYNIENPPPIVLTKNSRGNESIICLNFRYNKKKIGKDVANLNAGKIMINARPV